jgi:hypothetical protein
MMEMALFYETRVQWETFVATARSKLHNKSDGQDHVITITHT